jgi:hypothetical protein
MPLRWASGAMIYIPSFIKIGSGIQKLVGGEYTDTHRAGDLVSLFLFFQNKKSRLKLVAIKGATTFKLLI